jgi:hypothetical protein
MSSFSFSLNELYSDRQIYYAIRTVSQTNQAELSSSQTDSSAKPDPNRPAATNGSLSGSSLSYARQFTTSLTTGTISANVGLTKGNLSQTTATLTKSDDISGAQSDGTSLSDHQSTTASITETSFSKNNWASGLVQNSVGFTNDQTDKIALTPGTTPGADASVAVDHAQGISGYTSTSKVSSVLATTYSDYQLTRVSAGAETSAAGGAIDLTPTTAPPDAPKRALTAIGTGTANSETDESVWDQSVYKFNIVIGGVTRQFTAYDITRSNSVSVGQTAAIGIAAQTSISNGSGANGIAASASLLLGANSAGSISSSQRTIVIFDEPWLTERGVDESFNGQHDDPLHTSSIGVDATDQIVATPALDSKSLTIHDPGDRTAVEIGDFDLVFTTGGGAQLVDNKPRKAAEKLAKLTPDVIAKQAAALTRVSGRDQITLARQDVALTLVAHVSNVYAKAAGSSSLDVGVKPAGVVPPTPKTVTPVITTNAEIVTAPKSVTVFA